MLCSVSLYIFSTKRQQRSDDMSLYRQDAVKARKTSSAEKIDEEGLSGIVAMMGCKDSGIVLLTTHLFEKIVT